MNSSPGHPSVGGEGHSGRVGRTSVERLVPSNTTAFEHVAAIHIDEIHHGVLPLLGHAFMTRVYRGLSAAPRSGVWAARDGQRIVGFLAGCADARSVYRTLLLRNALPLGALSVTRWVRSPELRRKVGALFRYTTRKHAEEPRPEGLPLHSGSRAELLAIAVSRGWHGRGIGSRLVDEFERALRTWSVPSYWVSTNVAEAGSNRFYVARGFRPVEKVPHQDLVLQVYFKQIAG